MMSRTFSIACQTSSRIGQMINVRPRIRAANVTKITVLPAPVNKPLSVEVTPRSIAWRLAVTISSW